MIHKLKKSWITNILGIERCIKCNKILSNIDKEKGGAGYTNEKSFSYCVNCSQGMITDLFSGKEPKILKTIKGN